MSIRIDGTNTTANPGITGSDTDTGLQFGTNEVKVVTDGSTRATVDSSGNLGMGTTTFPANGTNLKTSDGTIARHILEKTGSDARIFEIGNGGTFLNVYDATADAERLRILSDGGLTFNGDTAQTNALDDYEEGTWTPGVSNGTVTSSNSSYTKIGRIVTVSCTLSSFSNRTSTNALVVTGLPYTPSGGGHDVAAGAAFGAYIEQAFSTTYTNSSGIYIYGTVSGNYNNLRYSDLNNASSTIYLTARYIV